MGVESEEGRRKTGTEENRGFKKKKSGNRRFCTTTNNLTNSRKGKMLGLLFFFLFFCQNTGKKNKTQRLAKSVPSRRAPSPLSLRGSHASPPRALEEFECFFMDFLLLLMAFFPPGALPWGVSPGCHLPVLCRCPCQELGSLPVLLLQLNGVVAVADIGLLGGQCCKETQSPRVHQQGHLPLLAPVLSP